MHNPLKRPILKLLTSANQPLKEYDLHQLLGGEAFCEFIQQCSSNVALFRKHFLVMNALYSLHKELLSEGWYLQISALNIQLKRITDSNSRAKGLSTDSGFNRLSEYYLDWNNFQQTSDAEVTELLNQFWKRYLASEEHVQSLNCMGLNDRNQDTPLQWSEIQQRYRSLCQKHHPDKGGDPLTFIEIRQAYDNLQTLYKR